MYNYREKKTIFTISGIYTIGVLTTFFSKIGGIVIFLISRQDSKKVLKGFKSENLFKHL